jgi:hypothetical protein
MRNNHIAKPLCPTNLAAVHEGMPIVPTTPSTCGVAQILGLPLRILFDSLAPVWFNWLWALK